MDFIKFIYRKIGDMEVKRTYVIGLALLVFLIYEQIYDNSTALKEFGYLKMLISFILLPISYYTWESILTFFMGDVRKVSVFIVFRIFLFIMKYTLLLFLSVYIAPFGIISLYRQYRRKKHRA